MGRLFKREVSVALTQPVGFFPNAEQTTTIRDMRVTFEVEKNLTAEPNTCTVKVYNLAETTRALFQRKPLHVRLDAGYDGELGRLFTGDVRWSTSKIEGADWVTELQLGDGDRAHRFARCTRSYAAGVPVERAVKDTVKAMGLKLDPSTADLLRKQYVSGLSVSGNAARTLTKLLRPVGLTWSVQDGRLQVLASGDVRADAPIEVSQDTGLVGSPEYGAPVEAGETSTGRERKGHPAVLTFRMLLHPGIAPGGRVRVRSRAINGLFKVDRVKHTGDTAGQDWYSEVEARQVRG